MLIIAKNGNNFTFICLKPKELIKKLILKLFLKKRNRF